MPKTQRFSIKRQQDRWGFLFAVPALLFFSLFSFYPILNALYASFTSKQALSLNRPTFIGLGNYAYLLTSPNFWNSMRATAVFTLGTFSALVLVSLLLSAFISGLRRGKNFFQLAYYSPAVLSSVVAATMLVYFWKYIGYFVIICIAGMASIPASIYEATRLDGATKWQTYWRITFPLLRPTVVLVSIMSMLQCLRTFSVQYLFTLGGAPLNAINVITLNIYHTGIRDQRTGRASAMSIILLVIMVVLTWLQFRGSRSDEVTY
jgi:multiple sugar transport system permease protein